MPRRRPDPQCTATKTGASPMLPLDYLLSVMNDASADPARRDRMAICAAQYVHPKLTDAAPGKKDRLIEAAREAGGDEWRTTSTRTAIARSSRCSTAPTNPIARRAGGIGSGAA